MEVDESMKRPNVDLRFTGDRNIESSGIPVQVVSKGFINDVESIDGDNESIEIETKPLEGNYVYTGSELSKSEFAEKEVWIKQITELFKEEQISKAIEELKSFNKAYPNIPIDEQFKEYFP